MPIHDPAPGEAGYGVWRLSYRERTGIPPGSGTWKSRPIRACFLLHVYPVDGNGLDPAADGTASIAGAAAS